MRIEHVRGHSPKRDRKKNPAHGKKHNKDYGHRDDLHEEHDHHNLFASLDEHLQFEGWDVSLRTRGDGKIGATISKDGKVYQQTFDPSHFPGEDDEDQSTEVWEAHIAGQKKQLEKWLIRHTY